MPTLDLSSYFQPQTTTSDGTKYDNALAAVQTAVNGLDNNNITAAAGIAVTKIADPGVGKVVGSGGTSAAAVFPPGYEIVEAQVTTDNANSTVGSDTTLVTFSAATFEAVKYYLEIAIPAFKSSSPGATTTFKLREATVQVGGSLVNDDVSGANRYPLFFRLAFTPSAAAHTYNVSWQPSAGTSTVVTTGVAPAEFRIVKA